MMRFYDYLLSKIMFEEELHTVTDALHTATDATGDSDKIDKFLNINNKTLLLIIGIAVIVILALVIFLIIYRKKRNKKNKEIYKIDIRVRIDENEGKDISLCFMHNGSVLKNINTKINSSIIMGRSDLCDIYIDDATMSRQHFVIEYFDDEFYVQDLDTTNGTRLNGDKLKHKRRLEREDVITAGSLDIALRW